MCLNHTMFDFGASAFEDSALAESDRKSTRLNSSHLVISYAVFCLKKTEHPSRRITLSLQIGSAHVLSPAPLSSRLPPPAAQNYGRTLYSNRFSTCSCRRVVTTQQL